MKKQIFTLSDIRNNVEYYLNGFIYATITASYRGYGSYAQMLDSFVGGVNQIVDFNTESIELSFGGRGNWWYPPYSLEMENDVMPISLKNLEKKPTCFVGKEVSTFIYQNYDLSKWSFGHNFSLETIITNRINNSSIKIGDRVKPLSHIIYREKFNDVVVLCKHLNSDKYVILPLNSLFTKDVTEFYTPREMVYETSWLMD
jgi:hypothetical protein